MSCSHCGMSCACGANETIKELEAENERLREAVNKLIKIAPQNNVSAAIKAALLEGEKDD